MNPPDCDCSYVHASSPSCRSIYPSQSVAVPESDRLFPATSTLTAITLWEPWASAMACGIKTVETRSWRPPDKHIGKRVVIHSARQAFASNGVGGYVVRDLDLPAYRTLRDYVGGDPEMHENYPKGSVIAVGTLTAAYPTDDVRIAWETDHTDVVDGRLLVSRDEHALGDYTKGRWAWLFTDVRRLHPNPARGRQQFWTWVVADAPLG